MTFQIDENIIEILDRLIPDGTLSKIYQSAFHNLNDHNVQDRYAIAAHEFREIINIISREKSNIIQMERLDNSRKDNILEKLQKEEITINTNLGELLNHKIGKIVKIAKIIEENLQTLDYKLRAFFGLHEKNIPNQRLLKDIKDAHGMFNSISHHSSDFVKVSDFKKLIAVFNNSILNIGRSITQGLLEIDKMFVIQTPTEENINKLLEIMIFPIQEKHFFDNLDSPEWFIPLKKAGFFNNPPDMEEKDGWKRYPPWPQIVYLKKIFKLYKHDVLEIIKNSSETNNVNVIRVFLEILTDIEISMEERIKLLRKWFVFSKNFLIAFPLVDYLNSLIERDDPNILNILPIILSYEIDQKNNYNLYNHPVEPNLYFGAYEQLLMTFIPKICEKHPKETLKILCDLLNTILLNETKMNTTEPEGDQSILWRRTIEDHVQNPGTKYLKGELIEIIGNSFRVLMVNNQKLFLEAYELLKFYKFSIFVRLRMHLLLHYQGSEMDKEILSFLLDIRYLNHSFYWHEYYLLLQKHLIKLSEKDQNRVIEFIINCCKDDYDKFRLLNSIRTYLRENQRTEYIELINKYKESDHPEFNYYISSFIGPVSPVEKNDLSAMSINELIVYLKSWEPISGFHQPSRIGLARDLEQLISNDPKKYVEVFKNPSEIYHIYLLHLISGLKKAIDSNQYCNIREAIFISKKILDLPPKSELIIKEDNWESCDWSDILLEISELLLSSIKKDTDGIKKHDYDDIVQMTIGLLKNKLPIENKYLNYMTMEAGNIQYPHSFKTISFDILIKIAFKYKNTNEDISLLLDFFNKLIQDKSQLEYYAPVFGRHFISLMALNKQWALSIKNEVFPKTYNDIWNEAWKGYILHNDRIYTITHDLLREDYLNALNCLDDEKLWRSFEAGHLRYHIALWFMNGDEDLSNSSLVTIFFKKANAILKESFIQYIGECARDNYRDLPDNIDNTLVNNKCLQFWEWRLNYFKKMLAIGQKPKLDELENFDTLFAFLPIEEALILDRLIETIDLTDGKLSLSYFEDFFQKLVNFVKKDAANTLSIIQKVIDKMDTFLFQIKKDFLMSFLNDIKRILKTKNDTVLYNKIIDLIVLKNETDFKKLYINEYDK